MKAAILLMNGHEECEALIVYDLLYRAGIEVILAGEADEVTSSHKLTYKTNCLMETIKDELFDALILPGGLPGTTNLEASSTVQQMIDHHVKENRIVAAICAAPSILLHKGLLKDNEFTVFPGFESGYKSTETKAIRTGNFITGKGMGAGFEFSKEIIKALIGEDKADEVLAKVQF